LSENAVATANTMFAGRVLQALVVGDWHTRGYIYDKLGLQVSLKIILKIHIKTVHFPPI